MNKGETGAAVSLSLSNYNNRSHSGHEGDYFFMRIVTVPIEDTVTEETTSSCIRYSKNNMYSTLIKCLLT